MLFRASQHFCIFLSHDEYTGDGNGFYRTINIICFPFKETWWAYSSHSGNGNVVISKVCLLLEVPPLTWEGHAPSWLLIQADWVSLRRFLNLPMLILAPRNDTKLAIWRLDVGAGFEYNLCCLIHRFPVFIVQHLTHSFFPWKERAQIL